MNGSFTTGNVLAEFFPRSAMNSFSVAPLHAHIVMESTSLAQEPNCLRACTLRPRANA